MQKLLDHLARRTRSESSRIQYLNTVATVCRKEGRTPEQMVRLPRQQVKDAVQSYLELSKKGRSREWVNVCMASSSHSSG